MRNNPQKVLRQDALILGDISHDGERSLIAAAVWRIDHYPLRVVGWARALDKGVFLECQRPKPETGKYHNMFNAFVGWDCLQLNAASPSQQTFDLTGTKVMPKEGRKTIPLRLRALPNGFDHHAKLITRSQLSGLGTFDQWWTLLTAVHLLISDSTDNYAVELFGDGNSDSWMDWF
jgi:hypothetical protein